MLSSGLLLLLLFLRMKQVCIRLAKDATCTSAMSSHAVTAYCDKGFRCSACWPWKLVVCSWWMVLDKHMPASMSDVHAFLSSMYCTSRMTHTNTVWVRRLLLYDLLNCSHLVCGGSYTSSGRLGNGQARSRLAACACALSPTQLVLRLPEFKAQLAVERLILTQS